MPLDFAPSYLTVVLAKPFNNPSLRGPHPPFQWAHICLSQDSHSWVAAGSSLVAGEVAKYRPDAARLANVSKGVDPRITTAEASELLSAREVTPDRDVRARQKRSRIVTVYRTEGNGKRTLCW
jgi:hypothetical protein